ncbi:hypothetical protein ACLOJK_008668 [Asimina triloba]
MTQQEEAERGRCRRWYKVHRNDDEDAKARGDPTMGDGCKRRKDEREVGDEEMEAGTKGRRWWITATGGDGRSGTGKTKDGRKARGGEEGGGGERRRAIRRREAGRG